MDRAKLRHHVERSWRWVIGTALAWLAGLGAFFAIAPPPWDTGQPDIEAVAVGLVAGAAMALAMAATTGVTFLMMTRPAVGADAA